MLSTICIVLKYLSKSKLYHRPNIIKIASKYHVSFSKYVSNLPLLESYFFSLLWSFFSKKNFCMPKCNSWPPFCKPMEKQCQAVQPIFASGTLSGEYAPTARSCSIQPCNFLNFRNLQLHLKKSLMQDILEQLVSWFLQQQPCWSIHCSDFAGAYFLMSFRTCKIHYRSGAGVCCFH